MPLELRTFLQRLLLTVFFQQKGFFLSLYLPANDLSITTLVDNYFDNQFITIIPINRSSSNKNQL